MKMQFNRPLIWLSVLLVIASLACNFGGNAPAAPTPTTAAEVVVPKPEPTKPPAPAEPTPEPVVKSGAVSDLDGVKSAVVQIIAEGSFLDPGQWNINVGASGTGFIID